MTQTATVLDEAPLAPGQRLGRELSVVSDAGGAAVPVPTSYAQLQDMAQLMARGGAMVGRAFQGAPGACMGILTQALRWGMDPYAVSRKAYQASKDDPDAPIAYEGQLVHAVILRNAPLLERPKCSYSGEGPKRRIKVWARVSGEDAPLEYESPELSKLKRKSPLWDTDPDQQLWYYGVRAWARKHFPEILLGVYTAEEMDDRRDLARDRAVMTLSGSAEPEVVDAECTPVGDLLARKREESAAAKPVQNAPAQNAPAQNAPSEHKTAGQGANPAGGEAVEAETSPGGGHEAPGAAQSSPAATAAQTAAKPTRAARPAKADAAPAEPAPAGASDGEPAAPESDEDAPDAWLLEQVASAERYHADQRQITARRVVNRLRDALLEEVAAGGPLASRAATLLKAYPVLESAT